MIQSGQAPVLADTDPAPLSSSNPPTPLVLTGERERESSELSGTILPPSSDFLDPPTSASVSTLDRGKNEAVEDSRTDSAPFAVQPSLLPGTRLTQRLDFSAESAPTSEIDRLTQNALIKEIELLKLNTRFRAESTRVGKWKPWRLMAYGLAGNVCSNVGISHIAFARWKYWQRPALASKPFLRKGPLMLLIGHSCFAGGVLIETVMDALADYQTKRKGFDRKTSRNRVLALRDEIDSLIASREQAVERAIVSEDERKLLRAEGEVLKSGRESALDEFAKLSARAGRWKAARNSANAMIFAGATTGGYIGALNGMLAVTNRKPRLAVPAGIGFISSGSLIALTPAVARCTAGIVGRHEGSKERKLLGVVSAANAGDFDSRREDLFSMLARSSSGPVVNTLRHRAEIYQLQNTAIDNLAGMALEEKKAGDREFVEKFLINGAVGGTKIAWGTQLLLAGSDWSNTRPPSPRTVPVKLGALTFRAPLRPVKTPAQMFSKRVAQGSTCFIPGTALGALDAVQTRFRAELRGRRLKKNGKAPGQVLERRLKILQEMEGKLGEPGR